MSATQQRRQQLAVRAGLGVLVLSLVPLTSCSAAGLSSHVVLKGHRQSGDAPAISFERHRLPRGTFFVLAGRTGDSGNVWRLQRQPRRPRQLTFNTRAHLGIDSFATADGQPLVVADAGTGIDVIREVTKRGIANLPAGRGQVPVFASDGDLIFSKASNTRFYVERCRGVRGRPHKIYSQTAVIGSMAAGPGSTLAFESNPNPPGTASSPPVVKALNLRTGAVRRWRLPIRYPERVAWSPRAAGLAVGAFTGRGVVLLGSKGHGSVVQIPRGWQPESWSPNGASLMLANSHAIAVWTPGAAAEPRVIIRVSRPDVVAQARWQR